MRNYSVTPTMFHVPHGNIQVATPDKELVKTFHRLLDAIPDDNFALAIDHTVAQILRVHTPPNGQFAPEIILPPEEPTHDQ